MGEGSAQPRPVVAELSFGDAEILADARAFRAVAASQAFQGVEDGSRSVVVA